MGKPIRRLVKIGSPAWHACCAYHVALGKGLSELEAELAHDEALAAAGGREMLTVENLRMLDEPEGRMYADTDGDAIERMEKQIAAMQTEIERLTAWRDPLRADDSPSEEAPAPIKAVRDTIDHLLNGRVTPKDPEFRSLDRAMDQAKRGAVGPIPGAKG